MNETLQVLDLGAGGGAARAGDSVADKGVTRRGIRMPIGVASFGRGVADVQLRGRNRNRQQDVMEQESSGAEKGAQEPRTRSRDDEEGRK